MSDRNAHTIEELKELQSYPLSIKISLTKQRIREWIREYGTDGVYVSFSGGKDSTVLLDLVRQDYPSVTAVFVDTGLEFPEIREFVKTFDNVEWLKPKMNFRKVIEKYGYPFISKEVSECVYGSKKYLQSLQSEANPEYKYRYEKLCGTGEFEKKSVKSNDIEYKDFLKYADKVCLTDYRRGYTRYRKLRGNDKIPLEGLSQNISGLTGHRGDEQTKALSESENNNGYLQIKKVDNDGEHVDKDKSPFNYERYQFFLEDGAPPISNICCNVMKKAPVHAYQKNSGKNPMIGSMTEESRLRTQQWLNNGCNGFSMKRPTSNPMSFWTEQDVLQYIHDKHLPICPIYGDIVIDYEGEGRIEGQQSLADYGLYDETPLYKTTGMERTGCIFCGFGCHLEKSPNRFEQLKVTHPQLYEYIMKPWDEGGLGYKEVIDWINEHGNLNIKY